MNMGRRIMGYLIIRRFTSAAPVCIIAPISSWAAAASYVEDGNGLTLFIRAIPFNFYAILTIVMMIGMAVCADRLLRHRYDLFRRVL